MRRRSTIRSESSDILRISRNLRRTLAPVPVMVNGGRWVGFVVNASFPLPPFCGERGSRESRALVLLVALLQRSAENIAKRRARIGRAVLGDRLFLLGDFKRLDRHADLVRLLVELRHARIDLLANRETLGPLLGTVTREFVALDEG